MPRTSIYLLLCAHWRLSTLSVPLTFKATCEEGRQPHPRLGNQGSQMLRDQPEDTWHPG